MTNGFGYHVDAARAVKYHAAQVAALTSPAAVAISADIDARLDREHYLSAIDYLSADDYARRAAVAGLTDHEASELLWDFGAHEYDRDREAAADAIRDRLESTPALSDAERRRRLRNERASLRKWSKRKEIADHA